jgi:exodeoxyribonuclease III
VNSLNVRLPHVLDWLRDNPVDVLCLQETKQEDIKFPYTELKEAGYEAIHNGQKTYNGVAILSRHAIDDVTHGIANFEDEQKRVISATINGVRVVCVYVVNGLQRSLKNIRI